jgi:hypothetical protein
METWDTREFRREFRAVIERIRGRLGKRVEHEILYLVDALPPGTDPDVDALLALRARAIQQIAGELKRLGTHGEIVPSHDHRGDSTRILLTRAGYRYGYGEYAPVVLRRLQEMKAGIGADAVWKALPTARANWLRQNAEGDWYPHDEWYKHSNSAAPAPAAEGA